MTIASVNDVIQTRDQFCSIFSQIISELMLNNIHVYESDLLLISKYVLVVRGPRIVQQTIRK